MKWKMSVDDFWKIVEGGRRKDESEHEAARRITGALSSLDEESVLQWGLIYDRYHALANKGKLWGAANIMDDGFCSDDGFHYFRAWLISQGRDIYHAALQDPDSLATLPEQEVVRFESVNYAVVHAYEDMTGNDYYEAIVDKWPPRETEKEIVSGITFAPDIGKDEYINGHYPNVFPNLTKLYDRSDQSVDIGAGDTKQLISHSEHLKHFRYEDIDDGNTGIASLTLAHEIVESIRDNTDVRLGGMYARVAFMLDLAEKIEARKTDSATAIVEQALVGHADAARFTGRIRSYDGELQMQALFERGSFNHPGDTTAIANNLRDSPSSLLNDPAFVDIVQRRALHDKTYYTLSGAARRFSLKYSLEKMKDKRKIDPVGYTFAMRLAYTKVYCLNNKNMVSVYDRFIANREIQSRNHQKIELLIKNTPDARKSIADMLAQAKQAAKEQAPQPKKPDKPDPEL